MSPKGCEPVERAEGRSEPLVLSLFEGDPLSRFFAWIRLESTDKPSGFRRGLLSVSVTWVVLAVLAWLGGVAMGPTPRESFLKDVAAFAQFLIVVPLLLAAEPYLDSRIRRMGAYLPQSGLLPRGARPRYHELLARLGRARRSMIHIWVSVAVGYAMTASWIIPELNNGVATWHAAATPSGERLTLAGWWEVLFAATLLNFMVCRWVLKVALWCWCLRGISLLGLRIAPSHPDKAGGLAFLGKVQARFGMVIFAVGVMVAATIEHKVMTEGAPLSSFATWGPVLAFVLLAPPAFAAPLLFFTRPMMEAKRRAMYRYSTLLVAISQEIEDKWMKQQEPGAAALEAGSDLGCLADGSEAFSASARMRVIPFDYTSLLNLALSGGLPMLPVFADLLPLPEQVRQVISVFG